MISLKTHIYEIRLVLSIMKKANFGWVYAQHVSL